MLVIQSRTAAKKSAGHTKNRQHHNRRRKGKGYGPRRTEGKLDILTHKDSITMHCSCIYCETLPLATLSWVNI